MNSQNKSWLEKWGDEHRQDPEYIFDSFMFDISEEVSRIMQARSISRTELARRMGCSKAYITKLLSGTYNYTIETLIKISVALEMELKVELAPKPKAKKKKVTYDYEQPVKKVAEE